MMMVFIHLLLKLLDVFIGEHFSKAITAVLFSTQFLSRKEVTYTPTT
jgi:hypothetical protein